MAHVLSVLEIPKKAAERAQEKGSHLYKGFDATPEDSARVLSGMRSHKTSHCPCGIYSPLPEVAEEIWKGSRWKFPYSLGMGDSLHPGRD